MAPKAAQKAAKKKAEKQKKVLIGCGVLLVIALIYAVITLSSLGSHPASSASAATTTAAGSTTPASTTPGSTTPDATPVAPVTAGITIAPPDYLHSFVRLGRKDPFNDAGPNLAAASSGGSSSGSSSSSSSSSSSGSSSSSSSSSSNTQNALKPKVLKTTPSKKPTVSSKRAVISINGKKSTVTQGSTFGHISGQGKTRAFRLLSVSTYTAVISLNGTKLQYTLNVGLPLTLKTKTWRFTLILEPNGSGTKKTVKRTAAKKH
jgi:hypothetical protein